MESVKDRFLRYVKIDTESQHHVDKIPSTDKQLNLCRMLRDELVAIGASDVALDPHGYVTATIPANTKKSAPVVGLLAHVDTVDAVTGANVKPKLTPNYDGGDIDMGNGYTLSPKTYPSLLEHLGEEIICTDGTTLLGADDKSGVAEIMTFAEHMLSADAPEHGKIRIGFTPDEEVGRGVDLFDVAAFGADFGYTIDGGSLGEINYEGFNAAGAEVHIKGVSAHTGSARGKMVNALLVAMELHDLLPRFENPACTDAYEGFFHLDKSVSIKREVHTFTAQVNIIKGNFFGLNILSYSCFKVKVFHAVIGNHGRHVKPGLNNILSKTEVCGQTNINRFLQRN